MFDMVIYALIEESTQDDALATGKTVFEHLVGAPIFNPGFLYL